MNVLKINLFIIGLFMYGGLVSTHAQAEGFFKITSDKVFQKQISILKLKSAMSLSKAESNQLVSTLLEPGLFKKGLNCEDSYTDVLPGDVAEDDLNLDSQVKVDQEVISTVGISLIDTEKNVLVTVDLDDECGNVFVEFRSSIDDALAAYYSAGLTRKGTKKFKSFFHDIETKYGTQ